MLERVSSANGAGKTGQIYMGGKIKLDHSLTSYTKISLKCIKYINVRLDTIKFLEENIDRTRCQKLQQYLFQSISQNNGNKNKTQWDLLKLKCFCTLKEAIKN